MTIRHFQFVRASWTMGRGNHGTRYRKIKGEIMATMTDEKRAQIDRSRRVRAEKKKAAPYDFLEGRTGDAVLIWIYEMQQAIARASGPARIRGKYKGHSMTNPRKWIRDISERVIRTAGILKNKDRDENMGMASVLGIVLVAWYVRIQRAKAMDPRRPIKNRKAALLAVQSYVLEVNRAMFVESFDPILFPEQEWENPWDPKARDGKFV